MALVSPPLTRQGFTIALLCALPSEAAAVGALLEQEYTASGFGKHRSDENVYTMGSIGYYNVIIVTLAGIGVENASTAASGIKASFPNIELALLVGICAGVPEKSNGPDGTREIFLGDAIISTDVVPWLSGTFYPDEIVTRNSLGRGTPPAIRGVLATLNTPLARNRMQSRMANRLAIILKKKEFANSGYRGPAEDKVYLSHYRHKHQHPTTCSVCAKISSDNDPACIASRKTFCGDLGCTDEQLLRRRHWDQTLLYEPTFHLGKVASGDMVLRSGNHRDKAAEKIDVIGFEMEGYGVWEKFNTIIIKAVCDYGDSHKDKKWQPYAQVVAAAYAGALLDEWIPSDPEIYPVVRPSMVINQSTIVSPRVSGIAGLGVSQHTNSASDSSPSRRNISTHQRSSAPLRCKCTLPIDWGDEVAGNLKEMLLVCSDCSARSTSVRLHDIRLDGESSRAYGRCVECNRPNNQFCGLISTSSRASRICYACLGTRVKRKEKTLGLMEQAQNWVFVGDLGHLKRAWHKNVDS